MVEGHENKENYHQLKKLLIFLENSMENMHTDVRGV